MKETIRDLVRRERWRANETAHRYLVWAKEASLHPEAPGVVWESIVMDYLRDFHRFWLERSRL